MTWQSKNSRLSGVLVSALIAAAWAGSSGPASATERSVIDTVKYVYPMGNGNFVIAFTNPQPACSSTSSPQYFWVAVGANGVTADGVKAMLATALTALAADKQISLAYDDATSSCYVNRMTVIS